MTRNDLYDIALRYKKAGLWKKLWDNHMFAVKLSCGEIGYISIMGHAGEFNGLNVYIGDDGLYSYRLLASSGGPLGSPYHDRELIMQQKCLQLSLDSKKYLSPEEKTEVSEYAEKYGVKFSGKNAYPQFCKFEPNYYPWKIKTESDIDALYEAIRAAVLLAGMLKDKRPEDIGIFRISSFIDMIPLFSFDGDTLKRENLVSRPYEERKYIRLAAEDAEAIAKVKKLPKKGTWQSEFVRMPEPVQNDPEDPPYYPPLLFLTDNDGYVVPVLPVMDFEKHPQALLEELTTVLLNMRKAPRTIRCRDERTLALIQDFCEKTGIKAVVYEGRMEALDFAEASLLSSMEESEPDDMSDAVEDIMESLRFITTEDLKEVPEFVIAQLKAMIDNDLFPKDIAEELSKKLQGL